MAHDNPLHLRRLLNAVSIPSTMCFVHIDKKSDLNDFYDISSENVSLSNKRINVYNADFSQVLALLILIQQAVEHPEKFDRFVLLSGADYPIQSNQFINDYFENNPKKEFIDCVPLPDPTWGHRISRYSKYKPSPNELKIIKTLRIRLRNWGLISNKRDYAKALGGLAPCVGATWWALTRNALEYILHFCRTRKSVVRFYKHIHNPDEAFFQTVLYNSPFKLEIGSSLTYVDWREGKPHPAIINEDHIRMMKKECPQEFIESAVNRSDTFLFARKFTDNSTEVVNAIDKMIVDRNDNN